MCAGAVSQFLPPPSFPCCVHTSVLCVCGHFFSLDIGERFIRGNQHGLNTEAGACGWRLRKAGIGDGPRVSCVLDGKIVVASWGVNCFGEKIKRVRF